MITAPKIDTDFLWDLAVLFVILAVVYLIGVFFYKHRISATSKKVGARKRELSPMVSEFLFLEEDATKDEKSNYIALKIEIRELLKEPFNRRVLAEILLDLRKDVSGEARQSLFRLYQDLGLHKDAFSKLKSWRWEIISKGILELTQMEVAESYSFVTKFINDKRSTIRKQAEIATVTLRHEGINYFLDTTRYKISEWQQLKLLDVIRNKKDFRPPRFKAWLTSNNKYVVLFALRLIKYYNQNDADESLIELVKHKNKQIKEEAIACIKEFNITAALDTLKLVFWNCSTEIKIAILGTIGEIGSTEDIEFLQLMDKKELNFAVKSKAISSINAISPETIMPSKGIQDTSRYSIPEDVSEKAVAQHEKKHADISPDKEEFVAPLVEETTPPEGDSMPEVRVQESDAAGTEKEVEPVQVAEAIKEQSDYSENMDTTTGSKAPDFLHMEVHGAEILSAEETASKPTSGQFVWPEDHLDFLPLITEANENGSETEEPPSDTPVSPSGHHPLVDMEVFYEECSAAETEPLESPFYSDEGWEPLELAFLPIVVENDLETPEATEDSETSVDIRAIDVHPEPIVPRSSEWDMNIQYTEETGAVPEVPLHELRDIRLPEQEIAAWTSTYDQYDVPEIKDAKVIFEEVLGTDDTQSLAHMDVRDAQELSVTNEMRPVEGAADDEVVLPVEDELLFQGILDDLIQPKESIPETAHEDNEDFVNPDWDLDESDLDFVPVSFEKDAEEEPSYIRIEAHIEMESEEERFIPKASIPKAIFGDIEFEASTRQLLNDLEEMGDEREIPLLKELLTHEKYDMFKTRINALIDGFNHSEEQPQEQVENALQPFSVFQDLFRTCDTEAKLILLNEVVAVGDEKELHFLEDLTQDDSPEIRKMAVSVLQKLKKKLNLTESAPSAEPLAVDEFPDTINFEELTRPEAQKPASDPNDIFDLNFDFTEEPEDGDGQKKKVNNTESTSEECRILEQLCQFSNKIVEKLNG